MGQPLLEVRGLKKHYPLQGPWWRPRRAVRAVDGVDLTVLEGETIGIVGESGCGKSTTGRCILRLIEPTAGEVRFRGRNILTLKPKDMRPIRRDMQMVFQDPFASLNPRKRIGQILGDPLAVHNLGTPAERRKAVEEMIEIVGLRREHLHRYPHEFSGGQRQRIGIARALILRPKLIVADEPVSALDVSIQAQILNLMIDLQQKFRLTYLFISHDLSVVRYIADRVAVMYLGKIVEIAETDELYERPKHPYTQSLLSAIPVPDPERVRERIVLEGELPSPANPPTGCAFHPRCPVATDVCRQQAPSLRWVGEGHQVACHLAE